MTDQERLDWLEKNWNFTSTWHYERGHTLRCNAAIEGNGPTLREAIDAFKSQHDRVMRQSW